MARLPASQDPWTLGKPAVNPAFVVLAKARERVVHAQPHWAIDGAEPRECAADVRSWTTRSQVASLTGGVAGTRSSPDGGGCELEDTHGGEPLTAGGRERHGSNRLRRKKTPNLGCFAEGLPLSPLAEAAGTVSSGPTDVPAAASIRGGGEAPAPPTPLADALSSSTRGSPLYAGMGGA